MVAGGIFAFAVSGAAAEPDSVTARPLAESPAAISRPLTTGFLDPVSFSGPEGTVAYAHARRAGARVLRIPLDWSRVAPGGPRMPAGFKPHDPADPRYAWGEIDRQVRAASSNGFAPLLYTQGAPLWAQTGKKIRPNDGPARPSPLALGAFAGAAAERYSGAFRGLPRVRYWQVWNEPNLNIQLMPQSAKGRPVSPDLYRALVNATARAVHAVREDNDIIAGGLAPFGGDTNDPSGGTVPNQERIRPLEFMRQMLCMSRGAKPLQTCNAKAEFDIWAHHPYTYGGPTHSAFHADDVSLGDLAEMRSLLMAAAKAGRVVTRREPAFWVTEFSYDSKPGDPKGLPPLLHARWVSEALYRMWQNGVSHVTWFLLRDEAFPDNMYQSGLYLRSPHGIAKDRPKLALRSFRFPFVAFWAKDGSIAYWGRTPGGVRTAVVIEQMAGEWRRVAAPPVDRHGIFSGRIESVRGSGPLRARLARGRDFSQPFSLKVTKDFRFCPWGSFC